MRAAVVEHGAPACSRRGNAEAEEAHSGLSENGACHANRRLHDYRLNDVGQNVVDDHPQITCAQSTGRLHEFAFSCGQHLRAHQACVADPTSERESRSEEHTSELQSLAYLVCRLLLEKKKQTCATIMEHSSTR